MKNPQKKIKHKFRRHKPPKQPDDWYVQLWRIVDGAIIDTFRKHPEYIPQHKHVRERAIRNSIAKRVVGAVRGYSEQSEECRR